MKRIVLATSVVAFPQRNDSTSDADDERAPAAMMSPSLPIRVFRPNEFLEIAFDTRTRTPIYVLERLEGLSADGPPTKRRAHFHEEVTLPEEFRSRNGHYRNSGYDRGHLAPAADFRHLPSVVRDTYTLCNTVPQNPSMNRHGWARLECFVRMVAEREWNENQATTYVITGPLWLPSSISRQNPGVFHYAYSGIGSPPALVRVPTHLFKVVAVARNDTIEKFAAFVMPNEETGGGRLNLSQYLVRLSDLEAVTGMHFFPAIKDFRRRADVATERILPKLSGERPVLLLTEDDSQQSGSKKIAAGFRKGEQLYHLCEDGKCRL